jgi:hypothetical protein
MTLEEANISDFRDKCAIAAMQSFIRTRHPHHSGEDGASTLAADSYAIADAMEYERSLFHRTFSNSVE